MKGKAVFFSLIVLLLMNSTAIACEVCTIPRLGRQDNMLQTKSENKKWFFEFLFEQQDWNEIPRRDAHLLHEGGQDIHNKTTEDFYHFTFGHMFNQDLSLLLEIPYIVRNSLNVADGKVGLSDKSQGIGDLTTMLNYRFYKRNDFAISGVFGVKSPTGVKGQRDVGGVKFEPELQPGSGSVDYLLGTIFEYQMDRFIFKGNATYSFKTEGAQDFEFGDVFSTSVFIDYIINPKAETLQTKLGVDINYQLAQKDQSKGVKDPDSGGNTLFVGPAVTIKGPKNTSVFGNFLYPVYQDLGGVHQELNFVWTAGGRVDW